VREKLFVDENIGLHMPGLSSREAFNTNNPHRFKVSMNNAMVMKILKP
jgi:hypothetical protein